MKNILILCIFLLSMSSFGANCSTFEDRTGLFGNVDTADGITTAFEICTPSQFANIRFYPERKFILGDDLDFDFAALETFYPAFTGELDGNGFSISNLILSRRDGRPVGLFETVEGAQIRNLTFNTVWVKGLEKTGVIAGQWRGEGSLDNITINDLVMEGLSFTGGLIGLTNDLNGTLLSLSNIFISGQIIGIDNVGGVIGISNSESTSLQLQNITTNLTISGNSFVGGVVGQTLNSSLSIDTLNTSGSVFCHEGFCAGVGGRVQNVSLLNATLTNSVTSELNTLDSFTAGAFGFVSLSSSFSNSSYEGSISAGGHYAAGFVAAMNSGSFTGITTAGTITVNDPVNNSNTKYVAGVLGRSFEMISIDQTSSSMTVNSSGRYVGGIAGYIDLDESSITNSFSTGDVSGYTSFIGGLVGFFDGEVISNSYSTGNVSVSNATPYAYVGGLAGYANSWNSNYSQVYATGNVTVSSGTADYIGGLIGFFRGGSLINCYTHGNVTGGRNSVGGISGIHRGTMNGCYSIGDVSATGDYVGGIAGHFNAGLITNSLSTSSVSGKAHVGGLVGRAYSDSSSVSISHSYMKGLVQRISSSTEDPSTFGNLVGSSSFSTNLGEGLYYPNDTTVMDLSTGSELTGQNISGVSINYRKLNREATFPSFDFTGQWQVSGSKWTFPGTTTSFDAPVPIWLFQ